MRMNEEYSPKRKMRVEMGNTLDDGKESDKLFSA
jgi:hypothetical protein